TLRRDVEHDMADADRLRPAVTVDRLVEPGVEAVEVEARRLDLRGARLPDPQREGEAGCVAGVHRSLGVPRDLAVAGEPGGEVIEVRLRIDAPDRLAQGHRPVRGGRQAVVAGRPDMDGLV